MVEDRKAKTTLEREVELRGRSREAELGREGAQSTDKEACRRSDSTRRSDFSRPNNSSRLSCALIVPALDERDAIGSVVAGFRKARREDGSPWLDEVVIVDNGSTDDTPRIAAEAGATVVSEPRRGYGAACLAGIAHLARRQNGPPEVVVFADGDGANDPEELGLLIGPIERKEAAFVVGSRARLADPGSLTPPQRFGNLLATRLMGLLDGVRATDLGPYRAIRWETLLELHMVDLNYGWTIEMQIKAGRLGVPMLEVDVHNRRRLAGRSKVGGTLRGVVRAGTKILWSILEYR